MRFRYQSGQEEWEVRSIVQKLLLNNSHSRNEQGCTDSNSVLYFVALFFSERLLHIPGNEIVTQK